MIVLVFVAGRIGEVAPEYGGHAEFVSLGEGLAYFDDLAVALLGAEIDRGTDRGSTHVIGFLHGAEENLVELVGISEQFVVIQFDEEGNFVRVFPRHRAEYAEGRSDSVTAPFDGELHDIFAVEIIRVLGKTGPGGMLNALINGKNGKISSAAEAAMEEEAIQIVQYAQIAVGYSINAINKIGTGKMQAFFRDFGILEAKQAFCFGAQELFDFTGACRCHVFLLEVRIILKVVSASLSRALARLKPCANISGNC